MAQQKIPQVVAFEQNTGCEARIEGSGAVPMMYDPSKGESYALRSSDPADAGKRLRLVAGPRLVATELQEIEAAKVAAVAEVEAAKVAASQQIATEQAAAVQAVKAEIL